MSALFSLERAGRYTDAASLCQQYAEDHSKSAFRDSVVAREGFYRDLAGESPLVGAAEAMELDPSSPAAALSKAVTALKGQVTQALVGFQPSTKGKLYLDGALVAEAGSHLDYMGKIVSLSPGEHLLAIEIEPSGHERWVLATVGSPWFVLGGADDPEFYDVGWHAYGSKPEGWPLPSGPEPMVQGIKTWPGSGLPRPPYIAFRPGPVPGMQSGRVMLIGADPHQRSKRVYLTKRFEWPAEFPSP